LLTSNICQQVLDLTGTDVDGYVFGHGYIKRKVESGERKTAGAGC
jgi:hypothetical protein